MTKQLLSVILFGFVYCALFAVGSRADEPAGSSDAAADPMFGKEAGQVRDDNDLTMKLVWCPRGFIRMEEVIDVVEEPLNDGTRLTQRVETRRNRTPGDCTTCMERLGMVAGIGVAASRVPG